MRHQLFASIVAATIGISATAHAATTCVFDLRGQRMALRADCQTDATITIPDGFTLDGRGRRITAVDPPGGHFIGAVVQNAGSSAHVRNVVIAASGLANVCDPAGPPDQRLAGILLADASGSVVNTRVLDINQGASGCQEGAAIAVRAGEAIQRSVRIVGNRVQGYQKTGILVNGNAEALVSLNRVTGLGPVDYVGQNGIQIGFGARATVSLNQVAQNIYTGTDAASAGILILNAGTAVEVVNNAIDDCDLGVRLTSSSEAVVERNFISNSTYDAIAVDGLGGAASGSLIVENRLRFNAVGIGLYGAGAQLITVEDNALLDQTAFGVFIDAPAADNLLRGNQVRRTGGTGISVAGSDNLIDGNRVTGSSTLDIENTGEGNGYVDNVCGTSSGAPIDCP